MYVPAQFKEERVPVLHEAIERIGFGTLVTLGADGMTASHVPMLIAAAPAPFGMLLGHLARANPQWRTARPEMEALAIFAGPHTYITPSWYETKRQTGKVVPTWNYVAIHAYGHLRFIDDPERARANVTGLTKRHEANRAAPWAVTDAPPDFIAAMLKAIVAFELTITRLEGKWKMSQNRPEADRLGVIEGFREQGEAGEQLADLVAERGKLLK
jgi:transcriptional regulator